MTYLPLPDTATGDPGIALFAEGNDRFGSVADDANAGFAATTAAVTATAGTNAASIAVDTTPAAHERNRPRFEAGRDECIGRMGGKELSSQDRCGGDSPGPAGAAQPFDSGETRVAPQDERPQLESGFARKPTGVRTRGAVWSTVGILYSWIS